MLGLRPLPVQDNRQANHHQAQGHKEREPCAEGGDPHVPGDGLSGGQSFVEMLDGRVVLRHDPIGNERVEDGAPIVFGCSGIKRDAHRGDDMDQKILCRQGQCHQNHGVDEH